MRKVRIAPGEHYHIYNRGMNKQKIFLDESDYIRFLFCLLYFQSNTTFNNLGFYTSYFRKNKKFNLSSNTLSKIISNRSVELINFCLMSSIKELDIYFRVPIKQFMWKIMNNFFIYLLIFIKIQRK